MAEKWQNEPSEFGGYPGEIQPPPHELTAAEQARMERRIPQEREDLSVEDATKERMATGGEPAAGTEDSQ